MIRGAVYRVDLGNARGHEQKGKRLGVVVSPSGSWLSTVTIIPTSTSAGPSLARPLIAIGGRETRALCDQIRTIDTSYISGEPVGSLTRHQMAEIDDALTHYLGLLPDRPDDFVAPFDADAVGPRT